jgi:maltose/moltooligosaccharide transporter
MWVYTTPGVAHNVWNTTISDSKSASYNEAANWVGVTFAAYSLFGALFSLVMARIATKIGRKKVYMGALLLGGIGLFSMVFIHNQYALLLSMLGLGIAWAAILAMPYAILSATLPASRMGIFMGLFNATITIPQITAGLFGGVILGLLGRNAIMMLGVAGVSMVFAAFGVLFVKDNN